MDNLIERVKIVLLQPNAAWAELSVEQWPTAKTITQYVLPLAVVSAIASLIGYGFIGANVGFGLGFASVNWGIHQAVTVLVSIVIGCLVSAWVIQMMAPNFGTSLSLDDAVKLVGFSYTPAMVFGILNVLPSLGAIASLASLYGLYVLYLGFKPITKVADDKMTSYFIVSLLVMIGVFVVLGLIAASTMGAFGVYSGQMDFDIP